jgi:hypothetical protein
MQSRRTNLKVLFFLSAYMTWVLPTQGLASDTEETTKNELNNRLTMNQWLSELMDTKALHGRLNFTRFAGPIYVVTKPTGWIPSEDQDANLYKKVEAPKGFVTDFASVPRMFWSLLPPDGNYSHAAVLHDYLYWTQSVSRETADEIFRMAMVDMKIKDSTIKIMYEGVNKFGKIAWDNNAKLKKAGERRILTCLPKGPEVTWDEWKDRPEAYKSPTCDSKTSEAI